MAFDGLKSQQPLYKFLHLSAADTGTVRESAGDVLLHSVTINNAGASANILTLFNAATVATADTTTDVAIIDTVELNGRTLLYDIILPTGLVTKLETGTIADVTIAYVKL